MNPDGRRTGARTSSSPRSDPRSEIVMMRHTIAAPLSAVPLAVSAVRPAAAANKEHQQLMADIRMLQEQAQLLRNLLGSINDSIKAVNVRLDEQTNATRKAFADQRLLIDNLTNALRVV